MRNQDFGSTVPATVFDPDMLEGWGKRNSNWQFSAGVQQEIAQGLITSLPGRIGIVYFAGRGYVLSPLTTDREAALMYAESVHPAVVGRGG
ncbi:MAG: hypothetical protein IH866_01890 [Chloroflexi bacterium]|nr:hypothetical protein [Chloroflexota bacterium]